MRVDIILKTFDNKGKNESYALSVYKMFKKKVSARNCENA